MPIARQFECSRLKELPKKSQYSSILDLCIKVSILRNFGKIKKFLRVFHSYVHVKITNAVGLYRVLGLSLTSKQMLSSSGIRSYTVDTWLHYMGFLVIRVG